MDPKDTSHIRHLAGDSLSALNERADRRRRKPSLSDSFRNIPGDVGAETLRQGSRVDGRKYRRAYRTGARGHGGSRSDEVMGRRELDSSDDENQRRAESKAGQGREYDRARRVTWLNGGETNSSASPEQPADKQWVLAALAIQKGRRRTTISIGSVSKSIVVLIVEMWSARHRGHGLAIAGD
ncbi:hypothetical protein ACCO45_003952 [Purpureocillium lilacinum]|uniref:Uncharacterized protein n=1 Tax=Purpureocillium lilacinum TaxID=33203 RepID=A0ACC4E3V7_PURLI